MKKQFKEFYTPFGNYRMILKPLDRYARCSKSGNSSTKEIYCPHCKIIDSVGHLRWSGLKCRNCGKFSTKYDWLQFDSLQQL